MNKREQERLVKKQKWMEERSDARLQKLRFKRNKDMKIDLNVKEMELPGLPAQKNVDLKWRNYLKTRRVYLKRTKRILVVEEIKKGKEVYTVSGLNKSELNKVVEAIART